MSSWIILILFLLLLAYCIALYNGLVIARNAVDNAFAQIDVQFARRYDLIPNLVNVAKKYLAHEQQTLTKVIEARNQAKTALAQARSHNDDKRLAALSQADNQLSQQLSGFYALFEAYPDLKANTQLLQLSEEITSTENKIAFARQHFNDCVMIYHNRIEQFPANLLANQFGFMRKSMLKIDEIDKKRAPLTVTFDD